MLRGFVEDAKRELKSDKIAMWVSCVAQQVICGILFIETPSKTWMADELERDKIDSTCWTCVVCFMFATQIQAITLLRILDRSEVNRLTKLHKYE